MPPLFLKILLFSLIPVFTLIAGGAIAILKKPSGNVRSFILHFAAGVVFSVVAVKLLPDIVKQHSTVQVVIGFVFGFGLMTGIRKFTESKADKKITTGNKLPISLLVAIGVDIFIDGLLLGYRLFGRSTEGTLLAIALSVELLSLGMATASELGSNGLTKLKSIKVIIVLAMVFFISAVLGATLLHNLSHGALEIVLSFGLSALLFLVTEELLVEAHEEKESVWHTSAFSGGFLLFLILGMVA